MKYSMTKEEINGLKVAIQRAYDGVCARAKDPNDGGDLYEVMDWLQEVNLVEYEEEGITWPGEDTEDVEGECPNCGMASNLSGCCLNG